jgi:Domain of unknown function (DUF4468) with TBP-like fold
MKKIILLVLVCITFSSSYSQSKKTKKLLAEIEGTWEKDENDNITYTKLIENLNLSKDEIYTKALEYFTFKYSLHNSVIQVEDKENGIIIGSGLFKYAYIGFTINVHEFDTVHILKIYIEENKATISLTLSDYYITNTDGSKILSSNKRSISSTFPVNPQGKSKTLFGKAFYGSHQKAQESLLALEKALKLKD